MPVNPYDEENIGADDVIIRRIHPVHHLADDEDLGCKRVSTKAFSPTRGGGMSVDIEALILADKVDPKVYVTTPVYTGSVCFPAGAARAVDLMVGYKPIQGNPNQPDNPYHGEVWGPKPRTDHFTKSQKRALLNASEWFVEIPGVVTAKS